MSIATRKPKPEPVNAVVLERVLEIHSAHCHGPARQAAIAMVEATRAALQRISARASVAA